MKKWSWLARLAEHIPTILAIVKSVKDGSKPKRP